MTRKNAPFPWPRSVTGFVFKADIEHYFDTVDHDVLIEILKRKIKDRKMLWLLETIIRAAPLAKGLPIGNLTSQFLANVYLDPLDHYIKDHLKVKHYVRYMDDIVVLAKDSDYLKETRDLIRRFLNEQLKLQFKEKAVYINRRSNGIGFAGARIFPNYLRVKKASLKRGLRKFKQRREEYASGKLSEERYSASMASIIGHLEFFGSYRLRCSCGQALLFWR